MHFNRSSRIALLCIGANSIWNGVSAYSQSIQSILNELAPVSLDESALRELADQQRFKPYVLNPVLSPGKSSLSEWDAGAIGSVSVVKVKGIYHLYYEAWGPAKPNAKSRTMGAIQIGHAVSLDGVHWAKDPANPVLAIGPPGDWDQGGTWDPFVLYEEGQFKMWYGGAINHWCEWGFAVSQNGTHFEKVGQISENMGGVEDVHVVNDRSQGEYRLYYWDRNKADWDEVMKGPPAPSGLFVAHSKNETDFDFEHAQRIQVAGQAWPVKYSQVLPYQDRWMMVYGEAVTVGKPSSTGLAVSSNGTDWQKVAFPLIKGHDAEVIEAAPGLWFMYYGPHAYFDMPEGDVRLAIYEGPLDVVEGVANRPPTPSSKNGGRVVGNGDDIGPLEK